MSAAAKAPESAAPITPTASGGPAASRWWPTPAEAASVRFLLPLPGLAIRLAVAGGFFALGLAVWALAPSLRWTGLVLALAGHLPLWVRTQTTAPGGATPRHEEVWAPTESGWQERLAELERQGKLWDTSLWDLTSGRGCALLVVILAAIVAGAVGLGGGLDLGAGPAFRLALGAAVVLVPLWLNGIRTTWNPSELKLKGEALGVAQAAASRVRELDPVPMLALREGRRGKYPVDARLMLRPEDEDDSGFLGIQVQVAINNVRGTDYPYLYCVVLGKGDFRLPDSRGPFRRGNGGRGALKLVYERGQDAEVRYLVIRQYADNRGGWHTDPRVIRELVEVAVEEGREAWRRNRGRAGG